MNTTLSAWTSTSVCAVYYFHHPVATVSNTLKLNIKALQTVRFRLTVSDPNSPAIPLYTKEFSAKGPLLGGEVEVGMGDITFTRSTYDRYKLESLSGNNAINNISRFKFSTSSSEASYAAKYLSSPSVHLNNWHTTAAGAPSCDGYDWLFEEIMIPAESDLVGTYAEAIGALNGYMGIQMNGYVGGFQFKMGDVKDFVLSPMTSVNGVSVEGEIPADAVRYNISGQRVGQGAHGVVIVNGKKYIAK